MERSSSRKSEPYGVAELVAVLGSMYERCVLGHSALARPLLRYMVIYKYTQACHGSLMLAVQGINKKVINR
jgi:hypothetical protein